MKKTRLIIALVLCLMFAAVFYSGSVLGQEKTKLTNVVIAEDDDETVSWILIDEGDKIEVSVDVTSPSGGLVDVYIISYNTTVIKFNLEIGFCLYSCTSGFNNPTVAKEYIAIIITCIIGLVTSYFQLSDRGIIWYTYIQLLFMERVYIMP